MIAVLVVPLIGLLERIPAIRFRAARRLKDHVGTDLVYLVTGYVGVGAIGAAYVAAASSWFDAHTGLTQLVWPTVPFAAQVVFALVAIDLGNYVAHWWLHRSEALWQFHKAHHSSLELDWLATYRSHLIEQLFRRALAPVVLIVAGVPAAAVGLAATVHLFWATLNHSNLRLPLSFLEGALITPRLHRVHHVPATTDRNLGTVFTWWDRLRGTFVLTDPPPATRFGLPLERDTYPQDWARQFVTPLGKPLWPGRRSSIPSLVVAARSTAQHSPPRENVAWGLSADDTQPQDPCVGQGRAPV